MLFQLSFLACRMALSDLFLCVWHIASAWSWVSPVHSGTPLLTKSLALYLLASISLDTQTSGISMPNILCFQLVG